MIYSLTGTIVEKTAAEVVVSCGGVGYLAKIPFTAAGALGAVGSETTIFTHLAVSENDVSLYGFESRESRDVFRILITVSGVGPKAGVSILSALSAGQIVSAISMGDHKPFTAASGVGPKLAQRIVLELKDKIGKSFAEADFAADAAGVPAAAGGGVAQAMAALVSLGYTQAEAANSIKSIDPALPTAEIIRLALQGMGGKK